MDKIISIIIPVYNVEEYIDCCIKSIVNQTYKSLEIILIDDGSTDNSGKICDEWAKQDGRIKVIHKENAGVSAARNDALKIASGDFLGFVDADDWCESTMYERLLSCMIEEKADISICGYYDYSKGSNNPLVIGVCEEKACDIDGAIINIIKPKGCFTSLWNKLFRKTSVMRNDKVILMDTELHYGEDEVWLFHALHYANKVAFCSDVLYHWREREGSITRQGKLSERQSTLIAAKEKVIEMSAEYGNLQEYIIGYIFDTCYMLKIVAYCSDAKEDYQRIALFLKSIKKYWNRTKYVRLIRKIKVEILELSMKLHLDKRVIIAINNLHGN